MATTRMRRTINLPRLWNTTRTQSSAVACQRRWFDTFSLCRYLCRYTMPREYQRRMRLIFRSVESRSAHERPQAEDRWHAKVARSNSLDHGIRPQLNLRRWPTERIQSTRFVRVVRCMRRHKEGHGEAQLCRVCKGQVCACACAGLWGS